MWLPSDADMHFVLGLLVGSVIVGAATAPSERPRPGKPGRHHRKDER